MTTKASKKADAIIDHPCEFLRGMRPLGLTTLDAVAKYMVPGKEKKTRTQTESAKGGR